MASLSVSIERKAFSRNGVTIEVLRDLRFEAAAGEFISFLGPSGCGKTTLLRLIAGLDMDFRGRIMIDGREIHGPSPERGIAFQESRLLPWLTTAKNVAFAIPKSIPEHERKRRIEHALALVGLSDFRDAWPYQLSGGMEKRLGLARALVNLPKILLLDEPFSALDTFGKFALQDEIAKIHERERLTTVLVTHDVDEAVYLSDRIALIAKSPASVSEVVVVSLPRPRLRTSSEFEQIRRYILDILLHHR